MFSRWISAGISLVLAGRALSRPVNTTSGLGESGLDVFSRAANIASPYFVAYSDRWAPQPPAVSSLKGYNVFILAFLELNGPADNAQTWAALTAAQRSSIKSQYAAAGIKLLVSAFGSTEEPTSMNADPIATANSMAAWVKQYQLDGIDVDYEDFTAFNKGDGSAEDWLISFTQRLRFRLPKGQYIITHAPVAPWFAPHKWGGGGYLHVHNGVGSLIDWYNVQFYDQGTFEYTSCPGLLTTSSSTWPSSAVFQIASNGVPLSKIVIGKPATTSDASNGYMDTTTLLSCLSQAKSWGWTGGVMVWQYPDADSRWITAVRSQIWPA